MDIELKPTDPVRPTPTEDANGPPPENVVAGLLRSHPWLLYPMAVSSVLFPIVTAVFSVTTCQQQKRSEAREETRLDLERRAAQEAAVDRHKALLRTVASVIGTIEDILGRLLAIDGLTYTEAEPDAFFKTASKRLLEAQTRFERSRAEFVKADHGVAMNPEPVNGLLESALSLAASVLEPHTGSEPREEVTRRGADAIKTMSENIARTLFIQVQSTYTVPVIREAVGPSHLTLTWDAYRTHLAKVGAIIDELMTARLAGRPVEVIRVIEKELVEAQQVK